MKHDCNNDKWWELIEEAGGKFCIAVGKANECLAIECFKSKNDAYKQKNKWLTEFKMVCYL